MISNTLPTNQWCQRCQWYHVHKMQSTPKCIHNIMFFLTSKGGFIEILLPQVNYVLLASVCRICIDHFVQTHCTIFVTLECVLKIYFHTVTPTTTWILFRIWIMPYLSRHFETKWSEKIIRLGNKGLHSVAHENTYAHMHRGHLKQLRCVFHSDDWT